MKTEKYDIEEMFAAFERQSDKMRDANVFTTCQRRRHSTYRRRLTLCLLTLVADALLSVVLVWLFFNRMADGGDMAALTTIAAMLVIHTATGLYSLVGMLRHNPSQARPEETLAYAEKIDQRKGRTAYVMSRKVSVVAASIAIILVMAIPTYGGRTMSTAHLTDRAGTIANIENVLACIGNHWSVASCK